MFSQSFLYKSQNKEIEIIVEFPEYPDPKAEQAFIGYLKEIYLKKREVFFHG